MEWRPDRRKRRPQTRKSIQDGANVLAFGLPGVGKSHAAAALGHAMIDRGHSVLFTPTFRLVQELLAAKRDLKLPRALRRLDLFDVLILDDIGYVQQAPEEVEVLFTLMAERYERKSMLITSNLSGVQRNRRAGDLEPGLQRVGPSLQESHDHRRRHRPLGPPLDHPRVRRVQLPDRGGHYEECTGPQEEAPTGRGAHPVRGPCGKCGRACPKFLGDHDTRSNRHPKTTDCRHRPRQP